jgi:hypothetical protein
MLWLICTFCNGFWPAGDLVYMNFFFRCLSTTIKATFERKRERLRWFPPTRANLVLVVVLVVVAKAPYCSSLGSNRRFAGRVSDPKYWIWRSSHEKLKKFLISFQIVFQDCQIVKMIWRYLSVAVTGEFGWSHWQSLFTFYCCVFQCHYVFGNCTTEEHKLTHRLGLLALYLCFSRSDLHSPV